MTELIRPGPVRRPPPDRGPDAWPAGRARPRATDHDADDIAPTRVEGPICESTDALGTHDLPPLRRGDLVAIADAGAYAASQRSSYNGRPRPAHVMLPERPAPSTTLDR